MISQIKLYISQKNVPLKSALIIVFLILSSIASATDYYISSAGNDTNNGLSSTTPWKTIAKVNSSFSLMKPGDRILFNRGDTFYGTLTVTKSGSAGNPITIGAYGTGTGPIITGFTTISGWTNETGGIYSKTISCESKPNILTIDGVQYGMGRYPNTGTNLIIDSHSTNVSITDADLNTAVTDWTNAEVVIRKNEYIMDRCRITNHTSQTLTYTDANNSDNATDGYYYFIQDDLRTLDQFGEWYYDGTKLYMYFGADAPTNHIVEVPTINRLVYIKGYFPYITIDGLSFKGANNEVIYFYGADYGIVKNCDIDFAGGNGILMESANGLIDNNIINHVNQDGILNLRNTTITNNTIKNVGVIEGIGGAGSMTNGINNQAGDCLIQYNKIDSVGANGIHFGITGTTGVSIKNNLISNFSINMNDKGGIYTGGDWNNQTFNSKGVIDGNIIFNGIGKLGKSSYGFLVQGIYLDSYSSGISVTNNSIYHCNINAIMLSNASNITLQNNTCYDNSVSMYFLEWNASTIFGITMTDNIFFAKNADQITLKVQCNLGTLGNFGTADRNYYARPVDDNITINTYEGQLDNNRWQLRTLANWQSYTGKDANSHKSPIAITNTNDIRFEYNASKTNKIITLDQPMIDVKGLKYVNSITLLPFASVVLMVDPNPAQPVIPVYTGSVIENATPSLLEITYNVSLANIVPAASAFTVQVNSVVRTVNSIAISGTKIQLTLASPVVYGDIVTVAYTKPSTNSLQTASGGQAASFIAQTVTNKVASLTLPIYVSSSIENTTPSLLVMTYNMALANLVPAASSFSVSVNSVVRTVNTVVISGTKVQLTLASPIVYGDIVTFSYTKPASNPLQTPSGGIATSISNQTVINNCINIAPTVVITSPIMNSSFTALANITITANALDADGSVILVEFYNGSTKLASKAVAPYSFTWNNVAAGIYSLTVVATDNLNTKTTSSAISISVINGTASVNQPPVVEISNPLKGDKYETNSTITIDAIASDPDGSISKVEFYSGSIKLVELTSAPYTYTWKDVAAGSYLITAVATDNLNATTTSLPVEFEVGTTIKYDSNSEIVNLYPNPNNGHFSIKFSNPLQNDKSEIIITDLAGKEVYNGQVLKEETLKQFDLSNSKPGIYIMMIKDKEILVTKKFIKS